MSPRVKVTKQEILSAAYAIAETEGLKEISVRKIAAKLGCSVAPIYVNFENAEELMRAVIQYGQELHAKAITKKRYSEDAFLNVGIGSIMFAYEHKQLYKDIIEAKNLYGYTDKFNEKLALDTMRTDKRMSALSDDMLRDILFKMRTFTHGLCVFASAEILPDGVTLDYLIAKLEETGNDVINGVLSRI